MMQAYEIGIGTCIVLDPYSLNFDVKLLSEEFVRHILSRANVTKDGTEGFADCDVGCT